MNGSRVDVGDAALAADPLHDPQIVAGIARARLTIGVVTVGLALLGFNQTIGKGRSGAWIGWPNREFVVNSTNTSGSTLLLLLGILTIAVAIAPRFLARTSGVLTNRPKGVFEHGFVVIALAHLVFAGLGLYWWGHPKFERPKKEIPNWLNADGRTIAVHAMFFVALSAINLTVFLVDRRESK